VIRDELDVWVFAKKAAVDAAAILEFRLAAKAKWELGKRDSESVAYTRSLFSST
jgi:hypothetical protein